MPANERPSFFHVGQEGTNYYQELDLKTITYGNFR